MHVASKAEGKAVCNAPSEQRPKSWFVPLAGRDASRLEFFDDSILQCPWPILCAVLVSPAVEHLRGALRCLQPFKVASIQHVKQVCALRRCKPCRLCSLQVTPSYLQLNIMQRLTQVSFAVLALSCALLCTVQSAEPMPLSLTSGTCSGIPFTDLGQKFHYDAQVAITSGDANCIR